MTRPLEDYASEHHPQNVEARARRRVVGDLRAMGTWCLRAIERLDDPDIERVDWKPRPLHEHDAAHAIFTHGAREWAALHLSLSHWLETLAAAREREEEVNRAEAQRPRALGWTQAPSGWVRHAVDAKGPYAAWVRLARWTGQWRWVAVPCADGTWTEGADVETVEEAKAAADAALAAAGFVVDEGTGEAPGQEESDARAAYRASEWRQWEASEGPLMWERGDRAGLYALVMPLAFPDSPTTWWARVFREAHGWLSHYYRCTSLEEAKAWADEQVLGGTP